MVHDMPTGLADAESPILSNLRFRVLDAVLRVFTLVLPLLRQTDRARFRPKRVLGVILAPISAAAAAGDPDPYGPQLPSRKPRLSAVSHGLPHVNVASIALSTETNGSNRKHDAKVCCMTSGRLA